MNPGFLRHLFRDRVSLNESYCHGPYCSPGWPPTCNLISFSLCMLKLQVRVLIPSADILKNVYNREDVNQVAEVQAAFSQRSLQPRERQETLWRPPVPQRTSRSKDTCLPKALAWLAGAARAARAGSFPGVIYSSTRFLLFGFCCGFSFSLAFSRVNAVLIFDLLLTVLTA